MGLKLDWRGFLVTAGASVVATSFVELPAVLVHQETGRPFEPPGDDSRIVGDPYVIQMGIVQISIGKSASVYESVGLTCTRIRHLEHMPSNIC
jgi:hypothetical protein